MATDLLAMRTEMQEHGFSDTSTARLNALLNDAYYEVCSRYPWPFLEAEDASVTLAAASGDPGSLPTDLRAVVSLVNNSDGGWALVPERWEYLQKVYAGALTLPAPPVYYYFVADTLHTFPLSDKAYTFQMRYIRFPVALVNDTDVPYIPERHRRVIVLGALRAAYRMEDDAELGQVFENQFEARIQQMVEDLTRHDYDRPERFFITTNDFDWSD